MYLCINTYLLIYMCVYVYMCVYIYKYRCTISYICVCNACTRIMYKSWLYLAFDRHISQFIAILHSNEIWLTSWLRKLCILSCNLYELGLQTYSQNAFLKRAKLSGNYIITFFSLKINIQL